MTPTRTETAAERVDRLRAKIAVRGHPDLESDPAVQEARAELERAEQALRELPDAGHPEHQGRATRLEHAKRRYRSATSAAGAKAEQQVSGLQVELRQAEADLADDQRQAQTRVLDAARERAAADERTVEHAAADFDALRAGLCRILLDDEQDLRTVVEAERGAPVGPGQFVAVAIGQVSERRADDRRPVTVICHMRDAGNAMILVPLDRLERLPEGVKAR